MPDIPVTPVMHITPNTLHVGNCKPEAGKLESCKPKAESRIAAIAEFAPFADS